MAKWDALPHEVKLQIGTHLCNSCDKNQWKLVNRELYTIYLQHYFGSLTEIDLSDRYPRETILNSPFEPGKWIKSLTNLTLSPPSTLEEDFDPTADELYRLINCCPNIKHVLKITDSMSDEQTGMLWSYFLMMIQATKKWKLKTIPDVDDDYLFYVHYYTLASYMKKSVTNLKLNSYMIDDFDCLAKFGNLKILYLGRNMVGNLAQCSTVLDVLPQLEELYVEEIAGPTLVRRNKVYNNIKKLSLNNYLPSTNQEVLQLQNSFPSLIHLSLLAKSGPKWPPGNISTLNLKLFLRFMLNLPTYNLSVCGQSNEQSLMESFYSAQQNAGDSLLTIKTIDSMLGVRPETTDYVMTINMDDSMIFELMVIYSKLNLTQSKVIDLLSNRHSSVSQICTDFCFLPLECGIYINFIVQQNIGLKTLRIKASRLLIYTSVATARIKELEFFHCDFTANSLRQLSKDFLHLDKLVFSHCKLPSQVDSAKKISMKRTSVDKLKIDVAYGTLPILLSVTIVDQAIIRYFVIVGGDEDDPCIELSKAKFGAFCEILTVPIVLYITFKSLNSLELNTRNGYLEPVKAILSFASPH